MSENKCPCCGDSISIFPDSGFYECDNCPFMCGLDDLPRIVAAMELAKAKVLIKQALTGEEILFALKNELEKRERVLEVFGK